MIRFNDRFLLLTFCAAAVIYGIAVLTLFFADKTDRLPEVSIGLLVSYTMVVFSYFNSRHAFVKSTPQFYRAIFGGMAIRFIFFIAVLFVIYKFTSLSLAAFILSFVVSYVVFQIFEIRFIVNQLKKQKHV
jgi:hypothetical protein